MSLYGLAKIQSSDSVLATIGSSVQILGIHSGFYEFGIAAGLS